MKSSKDEPATENQAGRARRFKIWLLISVPLVLIIAGSVAAFAAISAASASSEQAAVDASVKSDVRDTVGSVVQWESQDAANEKVLIDNASAFADADVSNKVFRTRPGTIIGVYGQGDGSYTVCGFNPAGAEYTTSRSAWGYDSTTGVFAPVLVTQAAEACVGATDSSGNDAS